MTDENNSWSGQSRSYQHPDGYADPVVVGQVMSYNDSDWSTFWSRGSSRTTAPTSSAHYVGKHVGEDSDNTRGNETIGYFVVETSNNGGVIEGLPFRAALGSDTVKGVGDSPAYSYGYTPFTAGIPRAAVVSMAGMDGGNGGWAMMYGGNPLPTAGGGGVLYLAIDEDQSKDTERRHTTEQVAYFIIDPPVESLADTKTVESTRLMETSRGELLDFRGMAIDPGHVAQMSPWMGDAKVADHYSWQQIPDLSRQTPVAFVAEPENVDRFIKATDPFEFNTETERFNTSKGQPSIVKVLDQVFAGFDSQTFEDDFLGRWR